MGVRYLWGVEPWLASLWEKYFSGAPECVVSAPGRVNLIGEHTDYNEGLVLPAAVHLRTYVAMRRASGPSHFVSRELGDAPPFWMGDGSLAEGGIGDRGDAPEGWVRYVWACGRALRDYSSCVLQEVEGVVASEVPLGAGLSSSAALEVAVLKALSQWVSPSLSDLELAEIAWRAENEYVGVRCGKMDQLISALGVKGGALFIDMRERASFVPHPRGIEAVPLPAECSLVVLDTGVRRGLAVSAYNQRVAECQRVVSFLRERGVGVKSLRDVTGEMLESALEWGLDEVAYKRARHVIGENERVLAFKEALKRSDWERVRVLCRLSHQSLRDDYEVSCAELDALAETCWEAPGCLGARMTGAGFGGSCVALVWRDEVEAFGSFVSSGYRGRGFGGLSILVTCADSGVRVESVGM